MSTFARFAAYAIVIAVSTSGCGGSYEETVADVKIPIPGGMTKAQEKGVELSLSGFGGAQASYEGKVDAEKVIEFYRKEMPARGWEPSVGLLSQGGMLTYGKDGKTVIVTVGKDDKLSRMTIMVAGSRR
jgi:hypothetical protein